MDGLLRHTAARAGEHLRGIAARPVGPAGEPAVPRTLPDGPTDPLQVVDELVAGADPGLVATPGPRYFGFVTGGALPAALCADWLVSAWDQNAFSHVSSPAAAAIEEVAAEWILDLLGLPDDAGVAFVTGCQMAHVTALAAARHRVLDRVGWSVPDQGLFGAPPVTVIAGEHRHSTLDRALRLLGIGAASIVAVDSDPLGRMPSASVAAALADVSGPVIVCAQAGEVNTGSFDPLAEIADIVADHPDAWLHIDGAFGLWVRASARFAPLAAGVERADSWAFDGHKWLNVPYDCGVAVVADRAAHLAAMQWSGDYLVASRHERDPMDWTPDASRRARATPVYAALRSLGRRGVAELVERCCDLAQRFASGLAEIPSAELLAEPVINQVLFRFDDDLHTGAVLHRIQDSGVAWMGPTRWHDGAAIRCSVSNWSTTEADVDATLAMIADAARR